MGGPFDGLEEPTDNLDYGTPVLVRKDVITVQGVFDGTPTYQNVTQAAWYRRVQHHRWGDVLLYEPLCYVW